MFRITICIGILFLSLLSCAQTNKKQWLIGGEGSFISRSNEGSPFSNSYTVYTFSPLAGYFILDRFAGGIRFDFSKELVYTFGFLHTNAIAPFLHYYIGKNQKVKFFIDGSYVKKWIYNYPGGYKENYNGYSLKIGPAIFFSQHIAFEIALGYYHEKETQFDIKYSEFQSSVGFKYHFGKGGSK